MPFSFEFLLTLSPSATSHIFSSVAGFKVGNVFPLTESTHSLLIKIYDKNKIRSFADHFRMVT